ncbi:MAG: protein-L-isoaspartate(D-aspartate) O-methyltransferase [Planctomycetota bacterium]
MRTENSFHLEDLKFRVILSGLITTIVLAVAMPCLSYEQNKTAVRQSETRANSNQPVSDANHVADSNENKVSPPLHEHRAFCERVEQRLKLVDRHIRRNGIEDPNVLLAMETVPRHAFVRPGDLARAYHNYPLPIGYNQTISQPYIVAYMTEALKLDPNGRVLEIGTGSGYQAAVCAELTREVYTIEIIEPLAETAAERLRELGYLNVFLKTADGYFGWPEKGPFDAIIVTAAAGIVPPLLVEQLKPAGRMVIPLGSPYGVQTLVLITKDEDSSLVSRELLPVRFVPMVGKVAQSGRRGHRDQ